MHVKLQKKLWSSSFNLMLLYVTIRKVAGSIPDEVIGLFNWPNPSSCSMALGSIQPLAEMVKVNLSL
jgi:hypothetical protein